MTAPAAAPSQERRDQLVTEAKAIAQKAKDENRDLTEDERTEIGGKLTEVKSIQEAIVASAKSAAIFGQLDAMAVNTPAGPRGGDGDSIDGYAKSLGEHFVKHGHELLIGAKGVNGAVVGVSEFVAAKAATDPQVVPTAAGLTPFLTEFDRNIVTGLRLRLTVADLLAQGTLSGNAISYLVEGAMEGDFAAVAEGGLKPQIHFVDPTSVTETLKKIAGWIRMTDEFIEDADFLRSEIDNRLMYQLAYRVEQQLLNGSGTGANILGLLNRSGIQTEVTASYATTPNDWPDGIFRAISKVEDNSGLPADGLIIHPSNYQTFRLRRDGNGQYYGGGYFEGQYGVGGMTLKPPLWGLRTVVTPAIAAGTVLVGAFQAATTLYSKAGSGVRVESTNSHASDFTSNLVVVRAEVRRALAVRQPLGLCKVTLTP